MVLYIDWHITSISSPTKRCCGNLSLAAAGSRGGAFSLLAGGWTGRKVTSGDGFGLATDLGGNALDRFGAEVDATVFGDQRPDVRNEELLGRILFDVLEF